MKNVQQIANTIHPSISVTIDFPLNNKNGRLPVLDLEMWIEKVNIDNENKHQILHSHYMKPISSKHVKNKTSALTLQSKMNILVADLLRIMRNISPSCNKTERTIHNQHFLHRMQYSGYNMNDRISVYRRAMKKYEKIINNNQSKRYLSNISIKVLGKRIQRSRERKQKKYVVSNR